MSPCHAVRLNKKSGRSSPAFQVRLFSPQCLLILALTGCLRLLLASDRGLLISLSLANLCNNTSSSTLLLKSSESAFQRFVVFDSNFSHLFPSHPPHGRGLCKSHYIKDIIMTQPPSVKSFFKKTKNSGQSAFRSRAKRGKSPAHPAKNSPLRLPHSITGSPLT